MSDLHEKCKICLGLFNDYSLTVWIKSRKGFIYFQKILNFKFCHESSGHLVFKIKI